MAGLEQEVVLLWLTTSMMRDEDVLKRLRFVAEVLSKSVKRSVRKFCFLFHQLIFLSFVLSDMSIIAAPVSKQNYIFSYNMPTCIFIFCMMTSLNQRLISSHLCKCA
jgi:hypothetical protein